MAIVLASFYGAKTLLGTATPSLETYWNTQSGKYGLVKLMQRFGNMQLPKIEVADVKELLRTKQMKLPFGYLGLHVQSQGLLLNAYTGNSL